MNLSWDRPLRLVAANLPNASAALHARSRSDLLTASSGATDYPLLVAVSSGRNRQRDLTRLSESKQVRQAKAVQKLVFAYPFRSVAPFSHPIPSIGWRSCLRTQI